MECDGYTTPLKLHEIILIYGYRPSPADLRILQRLLGLFNKLQTLNCFLIQQCKIVFETGPITGPIQNFAEYVPVFYSKSVKRSISEKEFYILEKMDKICSSVSAYNMSLRHPMRFNVHGGDIATSDQA